MRNDKTMLFEIPDADHRLEEICAQGLEDKFGNNPPKAVASRLSYELDVVTFVRKSEGIDYPYYFYDILDRKYLCPVYEDWKLADPETEILLITLKNKSRYALRYTH